MSNTLSQALYKEHVIKFDVILTSIVNVAKDVMCSYSKGYVQGDY